ncbi:MAG: hypothetical protein EAZ67_04470 [Cytophagales bacterium]|nr:MAG: hypothetical protein EAZ67_04470 [Cytophagales bacterium]
MKKKSYIPDSDYAKVSWLNNFSYQLPNFAAQLGVSAADVESVRKDAAMFEYAVETLETVKNYSQHYVAFKDSLRSSEDAGSAAIIPTSPSLPPPPVMVNSGIFGRVRRLVKLIKLSNNYNESIGRSMGIIGEEVFVDLDGLQPELKLTLSGGRVVVKWRKQGADSINLYVKRNEGDFVFLTNDPRSEYQDRTPLPENTTTWYYMAIFVRDDTGQEVGQYSEQISIQVKKMR